MAVPDPRDRFARLARLPDAEIDLAEAALWIAAEAYSGLDIGAYLGRLAAMAGSLEADVAAAGTLRGRVERLNRGLFVEHGLSGNREDYYDPRNSFLNEVLDRRLGIPISLSVVFVDVARRLGLDASGISFPGHFLVVVAGAGTGVGEVDVVVDAFSGAILSHDQCEERFRSVMGASTPFGPEVLRPAANKEILVRMLSNLKQTYVGRRELESALGCCDRILLLAPDSALELRDRGLLYRELDCFGAAVADLERFLALAPEHESARKMEAALVSLRKRARQVH